MGCCFFFFFGRDHEQMYEFPHSIFNQNDQANIRAALPNLALKSTKFRPAQENERHRRLDSIQEQANDQVDKTRSRYSVVHVYTTYGILDSVQTCLVTPVDTNRQGLPEE
jgi:hypothetical protein